jgi:hypothetical protein
MGLLDPAPMPKGTGYKSKYAIDFFKVMTLPCCLALIHWFHQWHNSTALIYTAIHGTYLTGK